MIIRYIVQVEKGNEDLITKNKDINIEAKITRNYLKDIQELQNYIDKLEIENTILTNQLNSL